MRLTHLTNAAPPRKPRFLICATDAHMVFLFHCELNCAQWTHVNAAQCRAGHMDASPPTNQQWITSEH